MSRDSVRSVAQKIERSRRRLYRRNMRIGMRLALTLCALGLAVGTPAAAATKSTGAAKKSRAAQMRERGLAAIAAGREDEALEDFGLAVEADPNEQVSHHEIGKILFRRGQVPDAIGHFRTAVRLAPKDASAWYNLAFAQRTAQKYPDAAESYRRYAALSPDDPDAYYGLAECLRQSGQARRAIDAYKQYLEKEKRPSEQKWVQRANERIAELQPQAELEEQAAAALGATATATAAATATPTTTPTATPTPTGEAGGARTIVHGANEAAPAAGRIAVAAPVDVAAKIAEGDSALAAKDFRMALYAYQDAIMADPKNVPARAAQAPAPRDHGRHRGPVPRAGRRADARSAAGPGRLGASGPAGRRGVREAPLLRRRGPHPRPQVRRRRGRAGPGDRAAARLRERADRARLGTDQPGPVPGGRPGLRGCARGRSVARRPALRPGGGVPAAGADSQGDRVVSRICRQQRTRRATQPEILCPADGRVAVAQVTVRRRSAKVLTRRVAVRSTRA